MPRESSPHVMRAREHLGRVDQLLAAASVPPPPPAAPPANVRATSPAMQLVRN